MSIDLKNEKGIKKGIGWNGKTLKQMLEESEEIFKKTGKYAGLDKLSLKEEDPIRYERVFSRIRGGLVNARETAMNISASPIIREIGELCFALYTPEGDSVALSTGIIVHVHTMSDAIKYMIRNNWEENPKIRSGDVFGNNDTFIGDVHNADVHTLVPIFYEGELIGWAGGVTHEIDVGAVTPGSMAYGQTSRYEDGFITTCEKIGENDELFQSYELRAKKAVRAPMYWLLDERTRLAGCLMIRDAVYRLIEEEGIDTYKKFIREVIEDGRRSFCKRVKETLIPGTYEAPSFIDVPFKNEKSLPEHAAKDILMHAPLKMQVGGEGEFKLSLEGANKWGYHSFNCGPSAMQGALWVQLTQTLIPNDKVNDGAYLATSFNLPKGSWANPENPLLSTTLSWLFLIPSFTGMIRSLARAYQARGYVEEVYAGYPGTWNLTMGGGPNQYGEDSAFTSFEHSCQGTGAFMIRDGEGYCAAMWNPEGDMGDVEAWEILEPLLYLGRRVKPQTAGMGKFRGGPGFESVRMLWKTRTQVIFNVGEGYVFHGSGIFGGYPGNSGYRHNMHGTNMKELIEKQLPLPSREGDTENSEISQLVKAEKEEFDSRALTLAKKYSEQDLYLSVQRGGPGLGDPLERDPKAIEEDLNEELVLPRFAERVYGAVFTPDEKGKFTVDVKATEKKRKAIRKQRASKAIPVSQYMEQERKNILEKKFHEPVREMYKESMELSKEWANHFRNFWNLPDDFQF
jgi:N-methylhydantoinase B/oxoprolinase/acetone carboxylase alpha subunit